MSGYQLAIFDLNGTVLDDESVWSEAFKKVFAEYEILEKFSPHQPGIGVSGNWQKYQQQFIEFADTEISKLRQKTLKYYIELLPKQVSYRAGVEAFIEALQTASVHCILATSLDGDILQSITKSIPDLLTKFEVVVTGDEVETKKPAPDIFLLAFERFLGTTREEITVKDCIVFEDSQAGVTAAQAANMDVVYLPNEAVEAKGTSLPTYVANDFTDKKLLDIVLTGGGQ